MPKRELGEDFAEEREATETGTRSEETEPEQDFTDKLAEILTELEQGRGSKVVTANAPRLWALFEALDDDDERRAAFYANIGADFDNSDGEINRSALLKYLVRLALEEHDADLVASLKQAKDEVEGTDDLL